MQTRLTNGKQECCTEAVALGQDVRYVLVVMKVEKTHWRPVFPRLQTNGT
jgi:hypothetical protein